MALNIESAQTENQLREFVDLPFRLHISTLWTPPLKKQQLELLRETHPFWQTARRKLFMARRDGRVVGTIAAIVDEKYNYYAGQKCGVFGFFECEDDREAAWALLDATREWLVEEGMEFMRGPLNPSTNYSCGLLVDGFEQAPAIMMPWNPPIYAEFFESWHLHKEQDLFAYRIERSDIAPPQWITKEIARLKQENKFTCRPASKAGMARDIHTMLDIYRQSWADNWGFSPLSPDEAKLMVKEMKGIVDPDLFVLFFRKGDPAGGMVALPDLNPLLKRLNGKIGLSAPWHWWNCRNELKRGFRIMLFGILPPFRLLGLPLLLFDYMLGQTGKRPEFEWVEGSWVLEDNTAIDDLIEDFGGRIVKRYRIYRKEIGPGQ